MPASVPVLAMWPKLQSSSRSVTSVWGGGERYIQENGEADSDGYYFMKYTLMENWWAGTCACCQV